MLFFGSIYRRNNKVLFGQESSKDISEMKRSIIFRFLVAVLCAAGCTSEKVADVPECHLTGTVMKTNEIIGTSLQEVTDTSLVAI